MKFNVQPHYLTVTLTLSLHVRVMDFAPHRTEMNILFKCNENPSRVGGDIEHTRN